MPLDYLSRLSTLLLDPVYRGVDVPRGKGEPVLLIPGFLGGDWTLTIMAGWLRRIGYRPYLSGIAFNVGNPYRTGETLGWRLAYIVEETNSPVFIVGHSLGGLLARFLGSQFPRNVRHVVALGSPIHDPLDAAHPLVLSLFFTLQSLQKSKDRSSFANGHPQLLYRFLRDITAPLPRGVSFTSIFTKRDEVVDWRSCLEPQGDNREVPGRHVSLIVNSRVYHALAAILATSGRQRS
jgi:pimeloyl-ACP methyl ester carboxylesterase